MYFFKKIIPAYVKIHLTSTLFENEMRQGIHLIFNQCPKVRVTFSVAYCF